MQYAFREFGNLEAFLKTDNITTDSAPRLEVRDANDPSVLDRLTEDLTGNSSGWVPVSLDFKTGPKTELVIASLTRLPSQKLDHLTAGRVWLDDVGLVRVNR